jgi:hypothetical protein
MAYVVATKRGKFEVRESHSTAKGPRSRTLVTFEEMDHEVIEKARERASKPLATEELRKSALRAGAPVAIPEVDEAGREVVRLLARGAQLDPTVRKLLLDSLGGDEKPALSDAARAAAQWIGAGARERGEALRDLLELADALPLRLPPTEIGFPRLHSV